MFVVLLFFKLRSILFDSINVPPQVPILLVILLLIVLFFCPMLSFPGQRYWCQRKISYICSSFIWNKSTCPWWLYSTLSRGCSKHILQVSEVFTELRLDFEREHARIVKNRERSEILSYFQAYRLACHSFMDSGSETKVFLTLGIARNMSFMFAPVAPVPQVSYGWHQVAQVDTAHPGGLCHS